MNHSKYFSALPLSILLIASFCLASCQQAPTSEAETAPEVEQKVSPTEEVIPEESGELTGEPIHIGLITGLTGAEPKSAIDGTRGIDLAIEEINRTGGINGRPLEVIVEDHEYRTPLAVDAAHKLIDVNTVPVILSSGGSSALLAIGEYAETTGPAVINMGASSPKLRDLSILCAVVTLDDVKGVILGEWAYEEGYRTAITIVPNNPYGIGVQDYSTLGFEGMGGDVLGQIAYNEGEADYRPEVQRIMDLNPDVIFSATYGDDGNLLLKQSFEVGSEIPWFITYPNIINLANPEYGNNRIFGIESGWGSPETQKFMHETFFNEYREYPKTIYANYGYDATMLIARAMKLCGPTSECILDHWADVAEGYEGVTGWIEIDEDCQRPNAPIEKVQYIDGELVLIKKEQ